MVLTMMKNNILMIDFIFIFPDTEKHLSLCKFEPLMTKHVFSFINKIQILKDRTASSPSYVAIDQLNCFQDIAER